MAQMMMWCPLFVFLLGCPAFLHGLPSPSELDAAIAAEPVAAVAPVVDASPAVVADPVAVPAATKAVPAVGGGVITEHKNPDGSVITVTRYNGPLPASTFQTGLTGLHESIYNSNLYQTQLIEAMNQALLRNFQVYNYNSYTPYSFFRTPNYTPYAYSSGPFFSPFYGFGGGYNPFFPGYGPGYKST